MCSGVDKLKLLLKILLVRLITVLPGNVQRPADHVTQQIILCVHFGGDEFINFAEALRLSGLRNERLNELTEYVFRDCQIY